MRFHEIDMRGKLWLQKVTGVPSWTSADDGRFIYETVTKTVYFGTDTKWVPVYSFQKIKVSGQSDIDAGDPIDTLTLSAGVGMTLTTVADLIKFDTEMTSADKATFDNFFTVGRKLWIYEDVAPAGWTILSAAGDGLLAVRGGTNAFAVSGGSTAGTWTQPTHTHPSVAHVHTVAGHTHTSAAHIHTIATHSHSSATHVHTVAGHTHTSVAHVHTIPSHTHTLPAHAHGSYVVAAGNHSHGNTDTTPNHLHATQYHVLTLGEMPKHGHYYIDTTPEIPPGGGYGVPSGPGGTHRAGGTKYTTENGNFDAHNHGNTSWAGEHYHATTASGDHAHVIPTEGVATSSSSGILTSDSTTPGNTGSTGLTSDSTTPGSTGASATVVTYRPYANVGIIIEKGI